MSRFTIAYGLIALLALAIALGAVIWRRKLRERRRVESGRSRWR